MAYPSNFHHQTGEFEQESLAYRPAPSSPSYLAGQGALARTTDLSLSRNVGDVRHRIHEIERDIFRHPNLMAHFTVVSAYLGLDSWLLEPISYLRQEGLYGEDMAQLHGPTVTLPHPRQVEDLREAHASLFNSPPSDLFELICKYRRYTNFQATGIVERLAALREGSASSGRSRQDGRTAPDGQMYACPSENCKKAFRKSGHAKNHVQNNHPEYLQLHPDYQPQQCMIEVRSSESTSPEVDRPPLPRSYSDQSRRPGRGRRTDSVNQPRDALSTIYSEREDYVNALSPRSTGASSSADTEESISSVQQSRRSMTGSGHRNRHTKSQFGPTLGSLSHIKRGREPVSSSESLATTTMYPEPTDQALQQRLSKRHSPAYPQPQTWSFSTYN